MRQIAQHGLPKPHQEARAGFRPIYSTGLLVCWSRRVVGTRPLFTPQHQDSALGKEALLHTIRRDPHQLGEQRSRWTLALLGKHLAGLRCRSLGGLSRLLRRLGITWKRARDHVHSPDPNYQAKLAAVQTVCHTAASRPGKIVVVYLDEITIYRQPSISYEYEEQGKAQARAMRSYRSNTSTRVIAMLERADGRVVYERASKIGLRELAEFYKRLRAAYADAERIYVVLDNWPVHWHPDVLEALEPQQTSFAAKLPPNWRLHPRRQSVAEWRALKLPIQLVPLPTYAAWCNPIEKLWRKLRQQEIHLHRLADALEQLRQRIDRWLEQYRHGSNEFLRYVGLLS